MTEKPPPEVYAVAAILGAAAAIDVACIRYGWATISAWCRHHIREHPLAAVAVAAALGAHLTLELPADPFRLVGCAIGRLVTITTEEAA